MPFSYLWCLKKEVVATSNILSGRESTCDSALSRQLYSVATLGDRAIDTMNRYPIQITLL